MAPITARPRRTSSPAAPYAAGLYGQPADLSRLDSAQNLLFTTDSRQLYAAIARDWWGVNPETVVRGRFEPVRFLKT